MTTVGTFLEMSSIYKEILGVIARAKAFKSWEPAQELIDPFGYRHRSFHLRHKNKCIYIFIFISFADVVNNIFNYLDNYVGGYIRYHFENFNRV